MKTKIASLITVLSLSSMAIADVKLPTIFSDNMVLQRDKKVAIWGTADAGEKVTVTLRGQSVDVTANDQGKWLTEVGPLTVGDPMDVVVKGKNSITLYNVLVGEVWICSGQSNMEFSVGAMGGWKTGVVAADKILQQADNPNIRMFTASKMPHPIPQSDVPGKWDVASSKTVPGFSAVGYFFAERLNKSLNVPIGMIHTSWGGTPAEAWTSHEALATIPDFKTAAEKLKTEQDYPNSYQKKIDDWENKRDQLLSNNSGHDFKDPNSDDKTQWVDTKLPGLLPDDFDGVMWFEKTVELPENWRGKPITLRLGAIDDFDTTFVNSKFVGESEGYTRNRNYTIPAELTKKDKLVIDVRVCDYAGPGGFNGKTDDLRLEQPGQTSIPLQGDWKQKSAGTLAGLGERPGNLFPGDIKNAPAFLFGGMVNPIIPYGIRGAIWYQGESNATRAYQYRTLFPTMIQDWRTRFGQGDFPFYFVQLASFKTNSGTAWPELREAQTMTLSLPNTGMAVALDLGNPNDIHPRNKFDVGQRLAMIAEAKDYGKNTVYSGPMYKSSKVEGDKIHITFDQIGSGLAVRKDEKLTQFTIAGADKKFVPATAVIEGNEIIVSNPDVKSPVAVRYAWQDNAMDANLINKEGLPASPFRTDDWAANKK